MMMNMTTSLNTTNNINNSNNMLKNSENISRITISNSSNSIVKKSILKKPSNLNHSNWQLKKSDNHIAFDNVDNFQFKSSKYNSLADMYLDYTLNSFENQSDTTTLNYPDILENSLNLISKVNITTSQADINLNDDTIELVENPIDILEEYEKHEDIISLNVDFSNDEEMELNCTNENDQSEHAQEFKFELNPQKYTLELSTLSSSSSSSSSKSSSKSSTVSIPSSTSSISYYDDFYISNKIKRNLMKNKYQKELNLIQDQKSKSTLCLNNNSNNNKNNVYANQSEIQQNHIQTKSILKKQNSLSSLSTSSSSLQSKKMNKTLNENIYLNDSMTVKLDKIKQDNAKQKPKRTYENMTQINKEIQRLKLKEQQKEIQTLKLKTKTKQAYKQQEKLEKFKNTNINQTTKINHIDLLDDFLLVNIFSKLNTIDKLKLQFVCKRWYRIIWSSEFTYKLFDTIEIVDESNNLIKSNLKNDSSSNQTDSSTSKNSAFSKFFGKKAKLEQTKTTIQTIEPVQAKNTKSLNVDKVIRFLLHKFLNRQTFPLCLCVEAIKIRNSNRLSDRSIELIAKLCPELRHLSLRNCLNIRSSSIEKLIETCENLKYLDLTGCFNINHLNIHINKINFTSNEKFLSSQNLAKTEVNNHKIISGLYKKFNSYLNNDSRKKIEKVNLRSKSRSDNRQNALSYCETSSSMLEDKLEEFNVCNYLYLQFIDLSYCSNITDKSIENICKSCIFIKNFYLRRCKQITDISLLYIAKYCSNIRELSLCQCIKITDTGIKYLANDKLLKSSSNKSLNESENGHKSTQYTKFRIKYLSLAKCSLVTDDSLIYLCKVGFFQQIKYLNLRGCTKITDKFIKNFVTSQSILSKNINENTKNKKVIFVPLELKCLDLSKCCITDKSIEYLCKLVSFKSDILQRLSLRYCENITDEGIKLLALNCKHLQSLNVIKCQKVTSQSLKEIKKNCQSCIIQHTNFSFC